MDPACTLNGKWITGLHKCIFFLCLYYEFWKIFRSISSSSNILTIIKTVTGKNSTFPLTFRKVFYWVILKLNSLSLQITLDISLYICWVFFKIYAFVFFLNLILHVLDNGIIWVTVAFFCLLFLFGFSFASLFFHSIWTIFSFFKDLSRNIGMLEALFTTWIAKDK